MKQRSRGVSSRLQFLTCSVGLTLSLSGIAVALPLVKSGVASFQTERVLRVWEQGESLPPRDLWFKLTERAEMAVDGYPVPNGEYFDRLGRAQLWGTLIEPGEPAHIQQALGSFRASVDARPDWPWSWLRLAHAKLRAGELDDEFDQAMQQTARLGDGRVGLQRDLVHLGFASFQHLTLTQRALILRTAESVVARSEDDAKSIEQIASAAGVSQLLCWAVDSSIETRQHICKEEG